jgi:hypothetical protein
MTKEEALKQLLTALEKVWNTPLLDESEALNSIMESYRVYRFTKTEE